MPLNLVKLCVGCESIEALQDWIRRRREEMLRAAVKPEHFHTTRMTPKRREELLDGGSLYWVIKGNVQCRQRLLDIRSFTDGEGVERCRLILDQEVVPTAWQPRRAFQGWRYLKGSEAPADVPNGRSGWTVLPPELRRELADLGLL
jgi:hypothetical protein